jgi:hypothetical protein
MGGTPSASYPYVNGNSVFPYLWGSGTGQLTISQNSPQTLGLTSGQSGTSLSYTGGNLYVAVNGGTAQSEILPYTVASSGTLQPQLNGSVPISATMSNPLIVLSESKGKWIYVANQGNLTDTSNAASGIDAFVVNSPFQLTELPGAPFGSGAGPQCMVEDPSNQFIYTANFNDSSITGRSIEQNSGELKGLNGTSTYTLPGQPSWCLVDGRTS